MSDFLTVLGIYCGLGALLYIFILIFVLVWRIARIIGNAIEASFLITQSYPLEETCSFIWSKLYDGKDVVHRMEGKMMLYLFDTKTSSSIIFAYGKTGEIYFAADRKHLPSSHWVLECGGRYELFWILDYFRP